MKCDIIVAGVGGQGIVSISAVIAYAALESGLYIKQSEVHGMAQRGGSVLSHLRISDKEIDSDIIPAGRADLIVAIEPLEALRYFNYLTKDGWIITNNTPVKNFTNYPDINKIMAEITKVTHHVSFDALSVAQELGNPLGMNMVMVGAAAVFIDLASDKIVAGIRSIFARKGEDIISKNLDALRAGIELSAERHWFLT